MKVKDIFTLNKDFKDFKLIAGSGGLDNEILSVDIMEVPDGVYWVNSGDFIITTGYSLKKNDTTMENIIQMLVAKQASALGIKVGRYIDEIPEKILQYADENNFPIICVPLASSYNSIVRPIINKLVSDENYDFYILKEIRHELCRLTNHNYNITAITNLLSKYVGRDVYIYWENNLNLVNESNNLKENSAKKAVKDCMTKLFSLEDNLYVNECDSNYAVFKINSMNVVLAFLCVDLKKGEKLTNTDVEIINEVIPFITMYLLTNSNKVSLYYKSLDEFYFSTIEGNYADDEFKLKEEASYRDIDFNKSRYVWIIDSTIKDPNEFTRYEKKIVSIMEMYDNVFYYKIYNKRITFIVENKRLQSNVKLLKPFYEKIVNDLGKSFKSHDFSIGISKICNSLKYMNYAYEEANFAIKIGKKLKGRENGVYLYDDFMIYHLLYEISEHPTLSKLYKNTIQRINKYDSENNSELLKTLEALVEFDFSISQTSDKLFIHRNTLYKRVNKINDILDSDIDKSENRLILQIALKLNEILN